MIPNMLVVDQHALGVLDAALIEDAWFQNFNVPANAEHLRRAVVGNAIYLLSSQADLDSGLLVVRIGPAGVFSGAPKPRSVFERIIRVALRQFDRNIALPAQWQPYREGALLSVYAEPFARRSQHRICFDQAPAGDSNIFAFAVTDSPQVMKQVPIDLELYRIAVTGVLNALTEEPPAQEPIGNFGILLSAPLGVQLAGSGTLEEWYERKLTKEQLRFVNKRHNQPVRLRGVAGTGKTQAMAVKCLRDLYQDADGYGNKTHGDKTHGDKTIAFLTHSTALAHEVVRGMFCALDPSERWTNLRTSSERPKLWIGTLYELAQERLGFEKKGLKPLSLDGSDGRELERLLIGDAIESVRKNPKVALGVLRDCPDFANRLSDENSRQSLIEELMNEFACVLDAENIRKGTEEADRYALAPREPWQMQLPTAAHRKAAIEIHDAYRKMLRKERFLSMDQMIADFGRYLSTHEWTQLRESDGFDLIFVDEYHYFTRVEVMTLQPLFAPRADCNGRWPLIMAYDLKQSTSDAPFGGGAERFRNPGVGVSFPVNLTQVFRSTPQITSFLSDLDASFPAIGLDGMFDTYAGHSKEHDGDVPNLLEFDTDTELIDGVLDRARSIARGLPDGGRQVAVLCLNEERFDRYRQAGRNDGKFVPVTSREDLRELGYAKTKCVFSMPEYVAGLQFDTVFLIHADRVDFENEFLSLGARRRYVSRAYLGASRAAQRLVIASSAERDGPSTILDCPLKTGSLKRKGV